MAKNSNDLNSNESKENIPQPITKLEINDRVIVIYRIRDILFKCYPNLVYSYKKGLSLKKILEKYHSYDFPTFDKMTFGFSDKKISALSQNLMGKNSNDLNSNDSKELPDSNTLKLKMNLLGGVTDNNTTSLSSITKKKEKNSTQQKDVFYYAFKNIRDRYQFKETRDNNIQKRKDNIQNELNRKKK